MATDNCHYKLMVGKLVRKMLKHVAIEDARSNYSNFKCIQVVPLHSKEYQFLHVKS